MLFAAFFSGPEGGPEPLRTIPLDGATHHVQGIDIDRDTLWVTSVDAGAKRGLLLEFRLSGKLVRTVDIQDGNRFHPGGMSLDGDSLWIPVAEYKRDSSAVIQRRNKRTLALEAQYTAPDHIGAIAVTPEGIVGANWDARDLYLWDRTGKLLRKMPNPAKVAFQDMKFVAGKLVGSGLDWADKSGVIVWMDGPSLKIGKRVAVGRTDRGVVYTHEGMTIRDGKLWLLPEDDPSRLFVFKLPGR